MKQSMKPISSPGRNDKFPPPLMRFLRNNAASRSRGRSKSTTIFPRKKNNTNTIETQEPSSPKVTCMGQVRVTRSSKPPAAKRERTGAAASGGAPAKSRWLPNPLFCRRFAAKFKHCSSPFKFHCHCQPFRPKNWGFLFRRKGSNSNNFTEASTKPKVNFSGRHNSYETEENETEEDETEQQEQRGSVSYSSSTPPRNALLLMRCRSEPYRSSSLASRFWGSPLNGEEETGEEQGKVAENRVHRENRDYSEKQRSLLQRESILEQGGSEDPKLELKLRFFKELEDSLRERIMEREKDREFKRREGTEEEEGEYSEPPRPMILTRCKSEPARIERNLDAVVEWNQKHCIQRCMRLTIEVLKHTHGFLLLIVPMDCLIQLIKKALHLEHQSLCLWVLPLKKKVEKWPWI